MNLVIKCYKPKGIGSLEFVRKIKRLLPKKTKIGHFGTLDPFAEGLLFVAIGQAARLNNFVHELLPKTYLAHGVLGVETDTGDDTGEIIQKDESRYLPQMISDFSAEFINQKLQEKFLGDYFQAPHVFSAAKFQGKKLHEWAREGIKIKKEPVKRRISRIEVVNYKFPRLDIRYEVSSGTYIRTLFSDCANELGTIGHLDGLVRESLGHIDCMNALELAQLQDLTDMFALKKFSVSMTDLLPLEIVSLNEFQSKLFKNGQALDVQKHQLQLTSKLYWVNDSEGKLIALAQVQDNGLKSQIIFSN